MALDFQEIVVVGHALSVVEVGDDQLILENALAEFDKAQIEAALEEGFDEYVMPNGTVASEYYAPYIRTLEELTAQYTRLNVKKDVIGAIVALGGGVPDEGGNGGDEGGDDGSLDGKEEEQEGGEQE